MTPKKFVQLYKKYGSVKGVSRSTDFTYYKVQKIYRAAVDEGLMDPQPVGRKSREQEKTPEPVVDGRVRTITTTRLRSPSRGVKRYLFTSAQNNTHLHEQFWSNLLALREHYNADLRIGRFTYKKDAYGSKSVKPGKEATALDRAGLWYDPRLDPYICDDRIEIANGLVWCGEYNRLPTTVHPLSGFETYTGRKSGIFPHVKLAMDSIVSMRDEPTKFNYTTGAVTVRNYIAKAAGIRAEFHHCYGALLAEVDREGHWFCRQVTADSDGVIYDMDVKVDRGKITTGNRVEAILWGDVHVAQIDPMVEHLAWGPGGMLDTLRPREQHMGDVLDFLSRTHHDIKDPHRMFEKYVLGVEDVRQEIVGVGEFLKQASRKWCKTVVIDSNHHQQLARWLREQDGRKDFVNVEFWLAVHKRVYQRIREGQKYNPFVEALREVGYRPGRNVKFLDQDEIYIICHDANGGIECSIHGHLGSNGSRGSTRSYVKMGRKVNKAHDHQAAIVEQVFGAGTCGILNPDYAKGPGGWSQSHVVTYPNAKRAIFTMYNGKWRAS